MSVRDKFHAALGKVGLYPPKDAYFRLHSGTYTDADVEGLKNVLKRYPDAARWKKKGDLSPLDSALWRDNYAAAEALIRHDPSILDDRSNRGPNIVMQTVADGDPKKAAFLFGLGADARQVDAEGNTLLHLAARTHYKPDMLDLLLEQGLDPKARNNMGRSPLMLSVRRSALFDALLKLDPDLAQRDNDGATLLMAAAGRDGSPHMIGKLADLGADLEARDKRGRTALDRALDGCEAECAMALIEKGAKFDPENPSLKSCMAFFAESGDGGFEMLVEEKKAEMAERAAREAAEKAAREEAARLAHHARVVEACTEGTETPVALAKTLKLKKPSA